MQRVIRLMACLVIAMVSIPAFADEDADARTGRGQATGIAADSTASGDAGSGSREPAPQASDSTARYEAVQKWSHDRWVRELWASP